MLENELVVIYVMEGLAALFLMIDPHEFMSLKVELMIET